MSSLTFIVTVIALFIYLMFDWVNLLGKVVYYDHCLLYVKVILHDDTKTYFLAYIAIEWTASKTGYRANFQQRSF